MSNVLPVSFALGSERLYGLLHEPQTPGPLGVLIVVGGPQYRVGSHRQFVLLARALSARGFPVLRFDYRGMGDSEGEARDFEAIDADIRAAVDCLMARQPGLQGVVIWGLCDAASAALFYAQSDDRIRALVLANPWVRTEAGEARAIVRHYYLSRLVDGNFWRRVARLEFDYLAAVRSLLGNLKLAFASAHESPGNDKSSAVDDLPTRMVRGLRDFEGPVLLFLSGDDLTAGEFCDVAERDPSWRELLEQPRVSRHRLPTANHTFSQQIWRDEVAERTAAWLLELRGANG